MKMWKATIDALIVNKTGDKITTIGGICGKIVEIEGEWYIFSHRQTNGHWFSRQGCAEKIELLPFKKLCTEKYEKLKLPFPLADTPETSKAEIICITKTSQPNFANGINIKYHNKKCPSYFICLNISIVDNLSEINQACASSSQAS